MNCKTCQSALPELLFGLSARASAADQARIAAARTHLAVCAACARELASFQATFALLDSWKAPAVSPYFDQKLAVRLREEQAAPPAGWFEKLSTRLLLNTGRQFRPALAGVMALLLIVGGGSVGISTLPHSHSVQASATINDLQILDKNAQAIQQMDKLLQEGASDKDTVATPPQS
jgi:anti-sigma factor RsiW